MATATKQKAVTFVSRGIVRLVKTPRRRVLSGESGESYLSDGEAVDFKPQANGVLVAVVEDPDLIKWLRGHRLFEAIGSPDGHFVEQGAEPGRPLPETSDLLAQIVDATASKDKEALAELYVTERASHSRPDVLKAAAHALEKLSADVPAPPATPLHEQMRTRAPGIGLSPEPGEGTGPAPVAPPSPGDSQPDNALPIGSQGEVAFASEAAEKAAKGRTDLVPGGGSGKDGAYTKADVEGSE